MNKLEELQNKPREKRTPLEQCVVDAATFEEAEHDGEIELMEQAAEDLAALQTESKYYKELYNEVAAKLNTANSKISRIHDICVSSK